MKESSIKEVFLNEVREILPNVESDLVLLEKGGDAELLNRIFRYAHTLKGSSAMAGFDEVSGFMHGLEGILDRLRSGTLSVDDRLVDLFLNSFDWVRLVLFGSPDDPDSEGIKRRLDEWIREYGSTASAAGETAAAAAAKDDAPRYYRVRARFRENIFESGIDPLSIIEDFLGLGTVVALKVDSSNLPDLAALDPEKCYLAWDATIRTRAPLSKAEEAFIFVKDDNDIRVEDVTAEFGDGSGDEGIVEDRKIGEILVSSGVVTRKELDDVLRDQDVKNRKLGDLVVEKGYATERDIRLALKEQERIRTKIDIGTVRVDTRKLDNLMNLLGEIVIGQSGLTRIADELPEEQGQRLKNALYGLDRTTRGVPGADHVDPDDPDRADLRAVQEVRPRRGAGPR